ncbi:MAG: hypothetical protein JXB88_09625 [Spirochaetales bacterium]|nr:hypothetical protein [Spirochaetales bacterium]
MKSLIPIFLFCISPLYSQNNTTGKDELNDTALITIDSNFKDWEKIPLLVRFSSYYNPYYYNLELNGVMEVCKIQGSFYWRHNGTQLEEIKALSVPTTLYFHFTTQSPIAEGLIIFLYLYKNREKEESNTYTLEFNIHPNSGDGKIYLWEAGKKTIILAGIIAARPRSIECSLNMSTLPEPLYSELMKEYSFDLTTCFFEKSTGMYEEFYFTTIFCKDIPTPEDL